MELFLLIAIGLSLISFISVALTKAPPQTFTVHSFLTEEDPFEERIGSPVLDEHSNAGREEALQEGSAGFLREEEILAHQAA